METLNILKQTEESLIKQVEVKKNAYTKAKWDLKSAEKALANIQKQIHDLSSQSTHG
jgi:hypothetical protein